MTSDIKGKPDCDFMDYCGDKADAQVMIGNRILNLCFYHAREEFEDTDPEDIEIDDSLVMFP